MAITAFAVNVGTVKLYVVELSLKLGFLIVLFVKVSVEEAVMYPSDVVANVAVLEGTVNV